jgi:hypothetical protein
MPDTTRAISLTQACQIADIALETEDGVAKDEEVLRRELEETYLGDQKMWLFNGTYMADEGGDFYLGCRADHPVLKIREVIRLVNAGSCRLLGRQIGRRSVKKLAAA